MGEPMKGVLCALCLFLIFSGVTLFPGQTRLRGEKIYKTARVNTRPPVIDGRLDDEVWKRVKWGDGFVQKQPYEGNEPSQETAFKILYDRRFLYVGIRAFDKEPGKIFLHKSRKDICEGDRVEIILDTYLDHRTGFAFSVNAAGVKKDVLISNDGADRDENWDPVWYVRTAVDEHGWTAEMKIPLSQLRFAQKEYRPWGLYVNRYLHREEEISEWKLVPRDAPGLVSFFGELHGLHTVKGKRNIELLPYLVGEYHHHSENSADPFMDGISNEIDAGLDGKIGLTNNFTLDLTVNPDFGQVEADPSEINLTAYETFFQEKRPFFIEGSNILNFQVTGGDLDIGKDSLFYSRRIGSSPQAGPAGANVENIRGTGNTNILAAFKLTGKTRGGFSIGVLDSVTSGETGNPGSGRDKLTNYFVLRLQKDYNEGRTFFGGMFTAANRDPDDPEWNLFHRGAYTGGLDFHHSWKNKEWQLYGNLVFSHVRGDREAILNTQLSSRRYFQRPDADHVELDPERTSLSGHGGTVGIDKAGGGRWRFSSGVTWRSPGLELNDTGYLHNADVIMQWLWNGYRITRPFGIFRQLEVSMDQWYARDFGGDTLFGGINLTLDTQFKNYWGLAAGVERKVDFLSTSALRGGPGLKQPGGWGSAVSIRSDERKKVRLQLDYENARGDGDSSGKTRVGGSVDYRPNSTFSISVLPAFEIFKQELQYVETVEFDDQKRYVFARIDQKTLSLTVRLNCSITPDFSIQFYGQPFISNGKYTRFKAITQPGASEYNDRFHLYGDNEIVYQADGRYYDVSEEGEGGGQFGFGDPDFNFLQFRSNLVLRWEYTPGSTLYLVWAQGRTGLTDDPGDFSFNGGMRDLFNIPPHNVFLLKFTYRFKI